MKPRCPHCSSDNVAFPHWDLVTVRCLDCGAVEDEPVIIPSLDDHDDMVAYFAGAPLGEPPAELVASPARKPVQPVRRKERVA